MSIFIFEEELRVSSDRVIRASYDIAFLGIVAHEYGEYEAIEFYSTIEPAQSRRAPSIFHIPATMIGLNNENYIEPQYRVFLHVHDATATEFAGRLDVDMDASNQGAFRNLLRKKGLSDEATYFDSDHHVTYGQLMKPDFYKITTAILTFGAGEDFTDSQTGYDDLRYTMPYDRPGLSIESVKDLFLDSGHALS